MLRFSFFAITSSKKAACHAFFVKNLFYLKFVIPDKILLWPQIESKRST